MPQAMGFCAISPRLGALQTTPSTTTTHGLCLFVVSVASEHQPLLSSFLASSSPI